jgi:hypothetical protein
VVVSFILLARVLSLATYLKTISFSRVALIIYVITRLFSQANAHNADGASINFDGLHKNFKNKTTEWRVTCIIPELKKSEFVGAY